MIEYKFKALHNTRSPAFDNQYCEHTMDKRRNIICKLNGCEDHLTLFRGPGSNSLCRTHQLLLREYGGFARLDRPWTFWKKDYCVLCNFIPALTEPLVSIESEHKRNILARMVLHVDHIDGNSYNNHVSNLQTLCSVCHTVKTFTNGDHWSNKYHGIILERAHDAQI